MAAPFPALPSDANPYASAGSGYAGAAASVYNSLQSRLQQGAAQHAALLRRKQLDEQTAKQRDFQNNLDVMKAGGELNPAAPLPDNAGGRPSLLKNLDDASQPTLDPAAPNAAATAPARKGQSGVTPGGTPFYMPTQNEKNTTKLDDTNSFVVDEKLAAEAQKGGLTNIRPGGRYPREILTELNQRLAAWHKENDPEKETGTYNNQDYVDAQGNPVPMFQTNRGNVRPANVQQPGQSDGGSQPPQLAQTSATAPAAPAPQESITMPGGYGLSPFQVMKPNGGSQPAAPPAAVSPHDKLFQDAVTNLQAAEDRSDAMRANRGAGSPGGPFTAPPAAPPSQPTAPGAVRFQPPQKNEPLRIIPGKKGPSGGMIVMNEKTNKTYEVPYPEGTSDELTAEQKERQKEFGVRQHETNAREGEVQANRQTRIAAELASHNDKLTKGKEEAKKGYLAAMKDAVTPEDKNAAAKDYKTALQELQTNYETNIGTTVGHKIDHNPWADQLPDGAAAPAQGTPAQGAKGAAANKSDPIGVRKKKPDPIGVR